MPTNTPYAKVTIGGTSMQFGGQTDLEKDIDQIEVEQDITLPDAFSLHIRDRRHDLPDQPGAASHLQQAGINVGAVVEVILAGVSAETPPGPEAQQRTVFKGEVTSIEGSYDLVGSFVTVRGQDKSHRLHRLRTTSAHESKADGDLVRQGLSAAGLSADTVDSPSGLTHKHFIHANLTEQEFLTARGKATGRHFNVDAEGKTNYASDTGVQPSGATLRWDEHLTAFYPRVTVPTYDKVEVRGWNHAASQAGDRLLKHQADATSKVGAQVGSPSPAKVQPAFGTAKHVHPTHLTTLKEVELAATSLAESFGGTYAEATAVADGDARLEAGKTVEIDGVSQEFNGKWFITSARHVMGADGFETHLVLSGRQDRSLLGLVSRGNGSAMDPIGSGRPIHGVVVGVVTNIEDKDLNAGRVKLKFPWLDDQTESDWAWVVQPGAGASERGWVIPCEVGDTVLVAFAQGDVRQPYVIGTLYSGVEKPQQNGLVDGTKLLGRAFRSRSGHELMFWEKNDSELYIQLKTPDGKHFMKIDQQNKKVSIEGDGDFTVTTAKNVTIESKQNGDIKVTTGQNKLEMGSSGITLESAAKLTLKGTQGVDIEGAMFNLKASATGTVDGGGMLTVKGGMVKIN
jgi:phage protein D